ncbi:MAG: inorganic phosphate transporter [Bacteroidota bacterium]
MENVYLIIVVILFALAISDLIVGVTNDAVNFLNSAVGAKAAPFRIIMIIAALGILVGVTFSNGMMEVARTGIFHPEYFYFSEIMVIFLAVMITDVIILDLFNTFGLPTSTTVSVVSELLGAAVAVALIKIYRDPNALQLYEYINTAKALAIFSGILVSVVISFSIGALIQFFTRLVFTFNYKAKMKYFGALWGSIAITAITYFMLMKGAKGSSFMSEDTLKWIESHTATIIIGSLIGWSILLQLLYMIFKFKILTFVVLFGTFALAMAFAGNDLVNFIGVPLAGVESFKTFIANPGADPNLLSMESLSGKVSTDTYLLLIAGLIMVATLWLSKKAKTVIKTSINLSRQGEGDERFGSSLFARSIIRASKTVGQGMYKVTPEKVRLAIDKRFEQHPNLSAKDTDGENSSFDMVRASVNLVVASILIAIGTSLKLPLSTTYVTFMVAMGTSLSDRAWDRDSAVYRITGVLSVIGGWFFTAFSAFTIAFIVALIISWGGIIAIGLLVLLAAFIIFRTHKLHKKREEKTEDIIILSDELQNPEIITNCTENVTKIINNVAQIYEQSIDALIEEDRKKLKDLTKRVKEINSETKRLKNNIPITIHKLKEGSIETGPYYVQVLDYLRETAHCLTYITNPSFVHLDNNHKAMNPSQIVDLTEIKTDTVNLIRIIVKTINERNFKTLEEILATRDQLIEKIENFRKKQIKRIKNNEVGTKNSMLYLGIYHETKNMLLFGINLLKSHRDFIDFSKK